MKKKIGIWLLLIALTTGRPLRADLFEGDVAVLTQILANAIQQLAQLRSILEQTQGNLELMQDVYRGIHDAMNILRTMNPNIDPGIFKEWETVSDAMRELEKIYGSIPRSPEEQVQRNTDQGVAEAVTFNNSLYEYTKQIDDLGEEIKRYSRTTSPAGAQKLTAQTLGVMLHVLNQMLRAQATGLKLQALTLENQNHKEKASAGHLVDSSNAMTRTMKEKMSFEIPKL